MPITPTFYNRDFSVKLQLPGGPYLVESYAHAALGGPAHAALSVNGGDEALWQLLDLLRCPVEFTNDAQQIVWNGYVAVVVLRVGALEFSVSLDDLGNKVTVAFGTMVGGHSDGASVQRATTVSAVNADSQAAYGTKELRLMLATATVPQASALRDAALAQRGWPLTGMRANGAGQGVAAARIECRGWWETLKWQNYASPVVGESQMHEGGAWPGGDYGWGIVPHGEPVNIATRFALPVGSETYYLSQVAVNITTVDGGAPTTPYNVNLTLRSDVANAPGVSLATATPLVMSDAWAANGWPLWTFTPEVLLAAGVNYWLVLSCSIAPQNHHQWPVWHGQSGSVYARGGISMYVSSWVTDLTWSLQFNLIGLMDTAQQVQDIIATAGQFIAGSDNELPGGFSGILSSKYRFGDLAALDEILPLLESGTSAGGRMLATVGPDRRVRLYAEPLPAAVGLYQRLDGTLVDTLGQPVDLTTCPCGAWVDQQGVVPPGVDLPNVAPLFPYFVEEASFNVQTGVWTPVPRGVTSVWHVAKIK